MISSGNNVINWVWRRERGREVCEREWERAENEGFKRHVDAFALLLMVR